MGLGKIYEAAHAAFFINPSEVTKYDHNWIEFYQEKLDFALYATKCEQRTIFD